MTRKKYINNMQRLILAIYNHPDSNYPDGYKVGNSLRKIKLETKLPIVIEGQCTFRSYEEIWNSSIIKFARQYYLGEKLYYLGE